MATKEQTEAWIRANQALRGTEQYKTMAFGFREFERIEAMEGPQWGSGDPGGADLPNAEGIYPAATVDDIPSDRIDFPEYVMRGRVQPALEMLIDPVYGLSEIADKAIGPYLPDFFGGGNAMTNLIADRDERQQRDREELDIAEGSTEALAPKLIGAGGSMFLGAPVKLMQGISKLPYLVRMATNSLLGAGAAAMFTDKMEEGEDWIDMKLDQAIWGPLSAVPDALITPAKALARSKFGRSIGTATRTTWQNMVDLVGKGAGDKTDDIINLLESRAPNLGATPRQAGEIAQGANRAEFNALNAIAQRRTPSTLLDDRHARNLERHRLLQRSGGTREQLDVAAEELKRSSAELYEYALNQPLEATEELVALVGNDPYIAEAAAMVDLDAISQKFARGGMRYWHAVKTTMDNMFKNKPGAKQYSPEQTASIMKAKKALAVQLGESNKDYKTAKNAYEEMAPDVQRRETSVGIQEIYEPKERRVPGYTDPEKGSKAVESRVDFNEQGLIDVVADPSSLLTGTNANKLEDMIPEEGMDDLKAVMDDLLSTRNYERDAAKALGISGNTITEMAQGGSDFNLLNAKVLVMNTVMKMISSGAIDEAMVGLNKVFRDHPDIMIELLDASKPAVKTAFNQLVSNKASAAVPGLVQAVRNTMNPETL